MSFDCHGHWLGGSMARRIEVLVHVMIGLITQSLAAPEDHPYCPSVIRLNVDASESASSSSH